jgi:hypothetical protein
MAWLEIPHWLVIAGAILVFAGLAGLALTRNKEVDTDPVLLPGDISEKRSTAVAGEEMTKKPGEVEPQKPISKAEREARKAFRQVDAEKAMTEHEIAQKAFSKNRERLKAERLERESAAPPPTKAKPKAKK